MSDRPCGGGEAAPALVAPRRNRYFYGKLLDAPHLQLEQRYGIDARRLLNRLSLGAGVVCGLDVVPTVDGTRVRVLPGVAVDFWGREIVVPAESPPVDVRQPTDECGRPQGDLLAAGARAIVWLAYHECETEPVPVLVGDCDTERACANSVIREQYAVVVQPDEDLPGAPSCGFPGTTDGASVPPLLAARATAGCADPPARSWVPLARVVVPAEDGRIAEEGEEQAAIDTAVRPVVATNQLLLELVLCLADRVEQCCGKTAPPGELVLTKVSGDEQTGEPGEVLPEPIVARVTDEDGNPVAGESVTFRAGAGDGRIAPVDDPGALHDEVVVAADADGRAAVVWELGPTPGPDAVRAEVASGAAVLFAATARQQEVDLPELLAVWPPNAAMLGEGDGQEFERWLGRPRVELTFDRRMAQSALEDPDPWFRVWGLLFDGEEALVTRCKLAFMGEVDPVIADVRGFAVGYAIESEDVSKMQAFVVQLRADDGTIVDTDGHLLDVDFRGTALDRELLARIWETGEDFIAEPIRPGLVDTGATLPATDGTAGGSYDGWFGTRFDR